MKAKPGEIRDGKICAKPLFIAERTGTGPHGE
jgi:hypothetical protein